MEREVEEEVLSGVREEVYCEGEDEKVSKCVVWGEGGEGKVERGKW